MLKCTSLLYWVAYFVAASNLNQRELSTTEYPTTTPNPSCNTTVDCKNICGFYTPCQSGYCDCGLVIYDYCDHADCKMECIKQGYDTCDMLCYCRDYMLGEEQDTTTPDYFCDTHWPGDIIDTTTETYVKTTTTNCNENECANSCIENDRRATYGVCSEDNECICIMGTIPPENLLETTTEKKNEEKREHGKKHHKRHGNRKKLHVHKKHHRQHKHHHKKHHDKSRSKKLN